MIQRTKGRMALCAVFLALLLAFIWGNSALPGQQSGQVSGWVGAVLETLLPFLDLNSPQGLHILRKLAHFSEFAALGACLAWMGAMTVRPSALRLGLPLLGGVASAVADETIQAFSPGRNSSLVDVAIDSAGVATGLAVFTLAVWLWHKRKK